MSALFRHIRAAILFGKRFPYMTEAEEWTSADGQAVASFFASGTGQKLGMRIRNVSIQAAMKAAMNPAGEHGLGIAAGVAMCAAMIDAHGVVQQEEEPQNVVNL